MELTPERRKEVIQFIEEHFPLGARELDKLSQESPERFERRVQRMAPEILRLMEVMKSDPQRGALMVREKRIDLRLRIMLRRYHGPGEFAEKTKLQDEVREQVEQLLDNRLQRRELELLALESRVAELKERLKETRATRQEKIDSEVRGFLSDKPLRGFRPALLDPDHRREMGHQRGAPGEEARLRPAPDDPAESELEEKDE